MAKRLVRMGIDVGGTNTKCVAIDNNTHEIIGKASVFTSHDHELGVAAGVVACFQKCMEENNISPDEVVFVAHSTTQATNALLEGDVAHVGIVGTAKGWLSSLLSKRQLHLDNIDLGTGREIAIDDEFIDGKKLTDEHIREAIESLTNKGVQVVVSTSAFGVDEDGPEAQIAKVAEDMGISATRASEITKLYGLSRRTRTAAINASILPKMLDTASKTESSVRAAGVNVPLMIMRGDGGVMDIDEMRKRPVLTMLSGPAASVMGSLMYLRASNGMYFEVGGTTTNIGVIKNGRPAIDYSVVGGHETYVSSLDVRVLAVAGGSMVRINKQGVVDVGPRSAHIAGLPYAVFTDPDEIANPQLELCQPKEGDPSDYVRVRLENGEAVTITNSCAANVLGYVQEGDYSRGNAEAARKAMEPVAAYCGITVEELCEQILAKSYEKIEECINTLAEKYKLSHEQISLVGCGGGAASLLRYSAKKMDVKYMIPENAEVISSIGVALSMVRDVVERVVPTPSAEDIRAIRQEATQKAIESGASADTIEVHIDINTQESKITAIATGSTEVQSQDLLAAASDEELKQIASEDLRLDPSQVDLEASTDMIKVFTAMKNDVKAVRIVDKKGFIKVQVNNAQVETTTAENYKNVVQDLYDGLAVYTADAILRPNYYVCVGARVLDFDGSSMDYDQLLMLMDIELMDADPDQKIIIVAAKNTI
ncbi:hydantoinase/oxoprolinase family protein [Alloscardovia venturai]|uniref:Hydantoinase/oxoprolinase family protein n=1 Tax=Alloscardovia venturai TaxID=1769421 RepID=A0ABW2Y3M0_9BIFI